MLTAFGWFVVGLFGLVLLAAVVFILGFLLSMIVSMAHGLGLGVQHAVARATHHGSGSRSLALHH